MTNSFTNTAFEDLSKTNNLHYSLNLNLNRSSSTAMPYKPYGLGELMNYKSNLLPFNQKLNSFSNSTCSGSRDSDFSDSESTGSGLENIQTPVKSEMEDKTRNRTSSIKSDEDLTQSQKTPTKTTETYMKKYKTELCKNFEMRGFCKWGNKCCFAHGSHELRAKKHLNNKYKSKICKHYHRHGHCPYGLRCQYFHIKDNYSEFLTAFVEILELKKKELGSRDTHEAMKHMTRLTPRLQVFKNICSQNINPKEEDEKSILELFRLKEY